MNMPLSKHRLFKTRELDEARARVAEVYCDHELRMARAGKVDAGHNHVSLGAVALNYMQYGADVEIEPGYLESFYLLQLPLDGKALVKCDKREVEASRSVASIVNPSNYTRMQWTEDCRKILIQLDKRSVEQCLAGLLGQPLEDELVFDNRMGRDDAQNDAWWRSVNFLLQEMNEEQPAYAHKPVVDAMARSLIAGLLYAQQSNYSAALREQNPQIAPKHVRAAEQYMNEHYRFNLCVEDLVTITGVSPRCLFEGFKKFRNTTPMRYLQQIRLAKVREALSKPGQDKTVTDIALECGFTQLGRFSVLYKNVFGESPSATLKNHQV
jgi:AraC-like DNA-binding protein